jgi:hypothetical protein
VEAADPSLTLWVPGKEEDGGDPGAALAVGQTDGRGEMLPRKPYRVKQITGSARGYSIDEFVPDSGASVQPDFTAMRLKPSRAVTQVSLVRGTEGNQVEASERRIKLVRPPAEPLLFLPALLPLALGLALRAGSGRRKQVVTG